MIHRKLFRFHTHKNSVCLFKREKRPVSGIVSECGMDGKVEEGKGKSYGKWRVMLRRRRRRVEKRLTCKKGCKKMGGRRVKKPER